MKTMLSTAIMIATQAHDGQFDKGGNPYILHPLAVAGLLQEIDEELQCIAILHDTIEDSDVTFLELRYAGLSERIISGITSLTKMKGESYEEYKEKVFANRDAMIVKMADLTHNSDIRRLKGVTEKDIKRLVKYNTFYIELKERLCV